MNNILLLESPCYHKMIAGMKKIIVKHRKLYRFIFMLTVFFTILIYGGCLLRANRKRLLCFFCAIVIFSCSSSFTFMSARQKEISYQVEGAKREADSDFLDAPRPAFAEEEETLAGEEGAPIPAQDRVSLEDVLAASADPVLSERHEEREAEKKTVFHVSDWKLILVNKQHPIPESYTFPIGKLSKNMQCDARTIEPLQRMLKDAYAAGVSLIVTSPYRSGNRQSHLFRARVSQYMEGGCSYADAYKKAAYAITIPGASEHQIGLAFDIITNSYSQLDEGFGDTGAGKWLADNAYRYGFILRYPKGGETVTGIEYEPWHFRYVGEDAAKIIYENHLTLEEFWEQYLYH